MRIARAFSRDAVPPDNKQDGRRTLQTPVANRRFSFIVGAFYHSKTKGAIGCFPSKRDFTAHPHGCVPKFGGFSRRQKNEIGTFHMPDAQPRAIFRTSHLSGSLALSSGIKHTEKIFGGRLLCYMHAILLFGKARPYINF